MDITISNLTACRVGGDHITITGTVDGVERTVKFHRSEFTAAPRDERDAFIQRVRSAYLEQGGLNTDVQIRNFFIGKSYKL